LTWSKEPAKYKERNMESRIVVLGFDNQFAAEGMLQDFNKMQEEGLIEIEDAVVASRGEGTHVSIKQTHSETGKFARRGAGVGLLAGLLLGGPIGGLVGGAAIGAVTGGLKDYGIDDTFIKEISEGVSPNSSALFLLVGEAKAEEVLERLRPFQAVVLTTTLPEEAEKVLRESLADEERP
jgi:uncharacterized membrane protein